MILDDPYFDKSIGDLRNLIGAKSSEELTILEPQYVFANEIELYSLNIPRTNNIDELLRIHKQLFKGVYDWAGKVRTVDIKKNTANAEYFLLVNVISSAADYVFGELQSENGLIGLGLGTFIDRLSYFYDQLNYIHPFREGNGRAQRVFWSRIARDAGFEIEWSKIVGDENDEASRFAAEEMDITKLIKMFTRIVKKAQ